MGSAIHRDAEFPTSGHFNVPLHLGPTASAHYSVPRTSTEPWPSPLPCQEPKQAETWRFCLGFQTYLSLSYAVLFWKKKNRKALAFRKRLPSRKTALPHPDHTRRSHTTGLAHCMTLPSHRSDELSWLSGTGTKGRKGWDQGDQHPQDMFGFQ